MPDYRLQTQVFISKSKIQSESKSQLISDLGMLFPRCLSVSQRYNLKANHNAAEIIRGYGPGVYQ